MEEFILSKELQLYHHQVLALGTKVDFWVSIEGNSSEDVRKNLQQAISVFNIVEETCSRFLEHSALRRLSQQIGEDVQVPVLLFEVIQFSLELAKMTHGLFDPTIGGWLEKGGFVTNYLTGNKLDLCKKIDFNASYRDVKLDVEKKTVRLMKPLLLDVGATAKGLALDLVVHCFSEYPGFCINAGGDVIARGIQPNGEPWKISIRNPFSPEKKIGYLLFSDAMSVCTSGGYERLSPVFKGEHHIISGVDKQSPHHVASATVMAPYAMLADGFSTVMMLLSPQEGFLRLEEAGIEGLLVLSDGSVQMSKKMEDYWHCEKTNVFQNENNK